MGGANGPDDSANAWHKLHSRQKQSGSGRIRTRSVQPSAIRSAQGRACVHRGALSPLSTPDSILMCYRKA